MKRKSDGWNIILAGFWNRMIFTPEWVSRRLFPEPEIETLVNLLPVFPLIYRDQDVAMEVSNARLVFRPRNLTSDQALLRSEAMARTVLQELPETPVQAVGVNFVFAEENPPSDVVRLFNDADDGHLSDANWTIAERKLTRKLLHGDDTLNLSLTYAGDSVEFNFNFHTDTPKKQDSLHALAQGRLLKLRDASLTLLRDVYHLQLDEDNDAN